MYMELNIPPYTLRLTIEDASCYTGTVTRLPDGVEGSFNNSEGLLCLLEGMAGRRWYQANRDHLSDLLYLPHS